MFPKAAAKFKMKRTHYQRTSKKGVKHWVKKPAKKGGLLSHQHAALKAVNSSKGKITLAHTSGKTARPIGYNHGIRHSK